jgi:hypothetical protein
VTVDFAVPAAQFGDALLGPGAPLWDLCERGLSVDPSARPHPSTWVAALEAALDAFGAAETMRAVWSTQGGGRPTQMVAPAPHPGGRDVSIRPVKAQPRPAPRRTVVSATVREAPWRRAPAGSGSGAVIGAPAATGAPGAPFQTSAPAGAPGGSWPASYPAGSATPATLTTSPSVGRQVLAYLAELLRWWLGLHRRAARTVWSRRPGAGAAGQVAVCIAVDAVGALVVLFLVAMIVAPVLGI